MQIRRRSPGLLDRIRFDTESEAVAIHAGSETDGRILCDQRPLARRGGHRVPGPRDVYELSKTLGHLMWVEPHEWEELAGVDAGRLTVNWMLAVPISDSEPKYLDGNGHYRLQELFIDRAVEYWNMNRRPIV